MLMTAAGLITLMSHSSGPANNGAGNRTGSNGTVAGCAGAGCHAANSPRTEIFPDAIDRTPGFPTATVTSWVPGHTYEIGVYGRNFDTTLKKFGYQITCVNAAGATLPAGDVRYFYPSAGRITSVNGVQLVEHTAPLDAPFISSQLAGYDFSIFWTPPAAGAGPIKFYITMMGSNGDGTANGDETNTDILTLNEQSTGIRNTGERLSLSAYPIPAKETLHVQVNGAGSWQNTATVYTLTGSRQQQITFTGSETRLDIAALAPGAYILVVTNNKGEGVLSFTK